MGKSLFENNREQFSLGSSGSAFSNYKKKNFIDGNDSIYKGLMNKIYVKSISNKKRKTNSKSSVKDNKPADKKSRPSSRKSRSPINV